MTDAKLEPAPNVVQELARLLSDAVKGEVTAIAFVEVRHDGTVKNGRAVGAGGAARANDFAAAIGDLFFSIYQERAAAYDVQKPEPPQPEAPAEPTPPAEPTGATQETPDGKDAADAAPAAG